MSIALSLLILLLSQTAALPAGTALDARLQSPVKTGASAVGDEVVAILTKPVRDANQVLIPQGARLSGRIETIQAATRANEGRVRLVFREIQFPDGRAVRTWITDSFQAPPPKRTLRYVLWVAGGAAAGGVIGGKAVRLAGILGGTIAGFVIAENSGDGKLPDLALKPGQILHLRLGEDLMMD